MRTTCPHCGSRAKITHSKKIDRTCKDIYVNCLNPECACRTVSRITHVGTLTPPLYEQSCAMEEWIANLPDKEKQALAKLLMPD